VPPSGGEDPRAGAGLSGEEGDDVAEDAVGEAADAVVYEVLFFLLPALLTQSLFGPRGISI
jgi:hypothetical protein